MGWGLGQGQAAPARRPISVKRMLELAGLFVAAFLSATLLPGSSEAAFLAVLAHGGALAPALAAATVGNTLGSCANWAIGRWLAH